MLTEFGDHPWTIVFPLVGRPFGLTVDNAASGHHALTTALVWWPPGMILAGVYFVFAYRMFFRRRPEQSAV
jgi:cytochrome bd-type quinol oxidase subunit 2